MIWQIYAILFVAALAGTYLTMVDPAIAPAAATFLLWGLVSIFSTNIEVQTSCCTEAASYGSLRYLAAVAALVVLVIGIFAPSREAEKEGLEDVS